MKWIFMATAVIKALVSKAGFFFFLSAPLAFYILLNIINSLVFTNMVNAIQRMIHLVD